MIQLWKHNRNGSPCKRPHLFLSGKLKSAFLSSWFMSGFKLIIRHLSTGKYLHCEIHSAQAQQPAKASQIAKIQLQWQHRSYFKHHLVLHNYCQLPLAKASLKLIARQRKLLSPKRFISETREAIDQLDFSQTVPSPLLLMGIFPQRFPVTKCRCPAFGDSGSWACTNLNHTHKPKGGEKLKGRKINPVTTLLLSRSTRLGT